MTVRAIRARSGAERQAHDRAGGADRDGGAARPEREAEGRIVQGEGVVDLPSRPECGRDRGGLRRPGRSEVEAVGVDLEDASPPADDLGVRHPALEAAGAAGQRPEELIDQAVGRRAEFRRRRRHHRAKGRLRVGRDAVRGLRAGPFAGQSRLPRSRGEIRFADELRLRGIVGGGLGEDADDVLRSVLAPGPEVERGRVRERTGRGEVVLHDLELTAEIHVADHDQAHECVGEPRRDDRDHAHLRQRRQPLGRAVDLHGAQDALVGLRPSRRGRRGGRRGRVCERARGRGEAHEHVPATESSAT